MALNTGRDDSLTRRHRALDAEIEAEQKRPLPNDARLRDLKRRKLSLKDQRTAKASAASS